MKNLFSLFDLKAHIYAIPVESTNMATAKRLFRTYIKNAGFPVDDFQVVCVATWDELKGEFVPCTRVVSDLGVDD